MSSETRKFALVHADARRNAIEAVREADDGMIVSIRQKTRSLDMNAKFHAICSDFAKSGIEWAGKARGLDEWKHILISGHAVATGQPGEVIRGFEGEFISIREKSATMTVKRCSSLIEYCIAMASQVGARLSA